jgi:shikimate dehydrogenase
MKKKQQMGLVGKNIDYSFSKAYFTTKFKEPKLARFTYSNFDLATISEFPKIVKENPNLKGLNVTIPYKEAVIPYLNQLSKKAAKIGAVNTIKFTKKGTLKGYNTDCYGFKKALKKVLQPHHKRALILGTGGASKAVAFALNELAIGFTFVSREAVPPALSYAQLDATVFENYPIIINCTPLGTFPNVSECPPLPYATLTANHLVFDLIYNPEETLFLKKAKAQGATTKNGWDMLIYQAEKAWEIWNK